MPKGVVLLADVIPSFGTKLVAPYFIHVVPYSVRVVIFVAISAIGMLLVALSPEYTDGGSLGTKLAGIVMASLSSGAGELSFLGLTHFYGPFSLAAWGSGTGAAGLVGAGAYALATTSLGLGVKATLLASACLPAVMLVSFFTILPRSHMHLSRTSTGYHAVGDRDEMEDGNGLGDENAVAPDERETLLSSSLHSEDSQKAKTSGRASLGWHSVKSNLQRVKGLFFPL